VKTEVFTYIWTYWDYTAGEHVTRTSDFKVTREYLASQQERTKDAQEQPQHRLLEDTRELVDSSLVDPEGRYHPKRS